MKMRLFPFASFTANWGANNLSKRVKQCCASDSNSRPSDRTARTTARHHCSTRSASLLAAITLDVTNDVTLRCCCCWNLKSPASSDSNPLVHVVCVLTKAFKRGFRLWTLLIRHWRLQRNTRFDTTPLLLLSRRVFGFTVCPSFHSRDNYGCLFYSAVFFCSVYVYKLPFNRLRAFIVSSARPSRSSRSHRLLWRFGFKRLKRAGA